MNTQRPNVFDYGHKELSQDAMICWLLEWSNERYRDIDANLHQAGRKFVRALFKKHDREPPEKIEDIKLGMQVASIDVLAWINNDYAILIEDKTETGAHGNQLANYHGKVLKGLIVDGQEVRPSKAGLLPIFLKTGNISEADRLGVERQQLDPPYRVFDRRDFLKALDGVDRNGSEILGDFLARLDRMEGDFNSWCTRSPREWGWEGWQGLYCRLEKGLKPQSGLMDWRYVPNQTGGFLGFFWHFRDKGYLQIETRPWIDTDARFETRLCFKIEVTPDDDRTSTRNDWHRRVVRASEEQGLANVVKPARFGAGKTMTVAVVENWLEMNGDRLDLESTEGILRRAQKVLDAAAGESG